jgi:hypothetical protein
MATEQEEQLLQVRFSPMIGRNGKPVLAYCEAATFVSPNFVSETGAPFLSRTDMVAALDAVGLPGKEIVTGTNKEYSVTATQLQALGLKAPSSQVPDWIKQQNAAKDRAEAQANERTQKAIENSMSLAKQVPDFWKRFAEGLSTNARALAELKGENLFGSVTAGGQPGSLGYHCQVNVDWRNASESGPELRMLVFHYAGTDRIRVTLQSWKETEMAFRLQRNGEVGVEYDGRVFGPEELAERIIQDLAKSAKKRAA